MTHTVKTTIDIDDQLFVEAKSLAARRKTTLKALVESALRRELRPAAELENPDPARFELGPFGILRLRRRPGEPVTKEVVEGIQEELDEDDLRRALHTGVG